MNREAKKFAKRAEYWKARAQQVEAEMRRTRAAISHFLTLKPSEICFRYDFQNCHFCDDSGCNDNQNPLIFGRGMK